MPGGNGFFPPVTYPFGWTALAVLLVVAVAAFYVAIWCFTRARDTPPQTATDLGWLTGERQEALRTKYTTQIEAIESAHRDGSLTARAAHQQLSLLLRFFAFESTGVRAPSMTLSDLRERRQLPLASAVEKLYPGAFDAVEHGSVPEAADTARRVVSSWD
ncbi:MAG: hypothetical protein H7146_02670 [Burkholderiaceae bacterium]|nr:hypothetical protein [Microbacteriaceae bacterium]